VEGIAICNGRRNVANKAKVRLSVCRDMR
jgi:hypothetical protein